MSAILKVRSVTQNGSHFFPDIHKINSERVVFTNLKGGYPGGPMSISLRNIEEGREVYTYVILDWHTAHEDEAVRDANGGQHGIPTDPKITGLLPEEGVREGANPVTHGWFFELKDKDGNIETVLTNTAAWLMSDSGKTLDRFYRE